MIKLRCGCSINEEGVFVLGDNCESSGCKECLAMQELHPFGDKRFRDL